jgi:hypothetical protein
MASFAYPSRGPQDKGPLVPGWVGIIVAALDWSCPPWSMGGADDERARLKWLVRYQIYRRLQAQMRR